MFPLHWHWTFPCSLILPSPLHAPTIQVKWKKQWFPGSKYLLTVKSFPKLIKNKGGSNTQLWAHYFVPFIWIGKTTSMAIDFFSDALLTSWGFCPSVVAALQDWRNVLAPDQWPCCLFPWDPPEANTLQLPLYPLFTINTAQPWAGVFEGQLVFRVRIVYYAISNTWCLTAYPLIYNHHRRMQWSFVVERASKRMEFQPACWDLWPRCPMGSQKCH